MRVSIEIRAEHDVGGRSTPVVQHVSGELRLEETVFVLEYEEAGEMAGHTRISGNQDRITVSRSGSVNTELVCEAGKRHKLGYELQGMAMEMSVFTKQIELKSTRSCGSVMLTYLLYQNGALFTKNRIELQIRAGDGASLPPEWTRLCAGSEDAKGVQQ